MKNIRPIPSEIGKPGFFSYEKVDCPAGMDYEMVNRFHNYYFTHKNWYWPVTFDPFGVNFSMDAFSPNLNKFLHVGHLRQLAVAASLFRIFPRGRFLAFLGTTLGIIPEANEAVSKWMAFVGYKPEIFHDTDFQKFDELRDGKDKYEGCKVWDGPMGEVVMIRSDGRPTYSFYDLSFAKSMMPTFYITGAEQREHFQRLGLDKKHLIMGLVLDENGQKIKSRSGDALSGDDALQYVMDRLDETPDRKKLAWNVLAWNFLHVNRAQNVRFLPNVWTSPDSPGMYITYTYARLKSALNKIAALPQSIRHWQSKEMTELDLQIMGWAAYKDYWFAKTQETMDMAGLANYVHAFARVLGNAYQKERIIEGRPSFGFAIERASNVLGDSMRMLGMFPLENV